MKPILGLLGFSFLLDLLTTGISFHYGAVEANPFMQGLNFWGIVAAKGGVFVLISLYITRPGKHIRFSEMVAYFGVFATFGVAMSNAVQLSVYVNPAYAALVPGSALVIALFLSNVKDFNAQTLSVSPKP